MCVSGSRNNNNTGANRPALCVASNAIVSVNEMKDLCVTVDNHLDFISHINNIVAWVFVKFNIILQCFMSIDVHT